MRIRLKKVLLKIDGAGLLNAKNPVLKELIIDEIFSSKVDVFLCMAHISISMSKCAAFLPHEVPNFLKKLQQTQEHRYKNC